MWRPGGKSRGLAAGSPRWGTTAVPACPPWIVMGTCARRDRGRVTALRGARGEPLPRRGGNPSRRPTRPRPTLQGECRRISGHGPPGECGPGCRRGPAAVPAPRDPTPSPAPRRSPSVSDRSRRTLPDSGAPSFLARWIRKRLPPSEAAPPREGTRGETVRCDRGGAQEKGTLRREGYRNDRTDEIRPASRGHGGSGG